MMVTNFAGAEPIYFISGIVMVLSGLNEIVLLIREYMEKRREEIVNDLADDEE